MKQQTGRASMHTTAWNTAYSRAVTRVQTHNELHHSCWACEWLFQYVRTAGNLGLQNISARHHLEPKWNAPPPNSGHARLLSSRRFTSERGAVVPSRTSSQNRRQHGACWLLWRHLRLYVLISSQWNYVFERRKYAIDTLLDTRS